MKQEEADKELGRLVRESLMEGIKANAISEIDVVLNVPHAG